MAQTFYTPFVIPHTLCGVADSTNFPVVISVTDARFKDVSHSGHVAGALGYDIRPYTSSALTTAYTYQLRNYNGTTGTVSLVVLVPTLSVSADTPIYLGYGDSGITTDGSSTAVWDASTKSVHSFGDGTTLSLADGTNTYPLTNTGSVAAGTSPIGGAAVFNGSSNYLSHSAYAAIGTTMTISGLVKTSSAASFLCSINRSAANFTNEAILDLNSGKLEFFDYDGSFGFPSNNTSVGTVNTGTWQYIAFTKSATTGLYYVGTGASVGTTANHSMGYGSSGILFGLGADIRVGGAYLNGSLAEWHVSTATRAPSWQTAEANNWLTPTSFTPLGTEAPVAGGASPLRYNSLLNGAGASGPFFRNPLG